MSEIDSSTAKQICKTCGENKLLTVEYFHFRRESGKFRTVCKTCIQIKNNAKNNPPINHGEKICFDCEKSLPATTDYFYAERAKPDGLQHICKDCLCQRRGAKRAFRPTAVIPDGHKECYKCRCILPIEAFCRNKTRRDGYSERCRNCANKARRKWYDANREYAISCAREYKIKHTPRREPRERKTSQQLKMALRVYNRRRQSRQRNLPVDYKPADWERCLAYWNYRCAVCGRPRGLWHILAQDHWIAVTDLRPDNPGTVPWNIVPLCHGSGGCNQNKFNHPAEQWLIDRFGEKKACDILAHIEAYFERVKALPR